MNMGINSSHAMPSGGELRFGSSEIMLQAADCEKRSLALSPGGGYLQVEIEDSGEGGIAENIFDKLFEPFFLLPRNKAKGPGLGYGRQKLQFHSMAAIFRSSAELVKGLSLRFYSLLVRRLLSIRFRLRRRSCPVLEQF